MNAVGLRPLWLGKRYMILFLVNTIVYSKQKFIELVIVGKKEKKKGKMRDFAKEGRYTMKMKTLNVIRI